MKSQPFYVCLLFKQRRLSFASNNNMSACIFDLVHYDTWGPYHVSSYNGFRYFLTSVDDYSCFTWVYLLKNKFDVHAIFPRFLALVKTQFQLRVKAFRTYNAPELEFGSLFSSLGVLHQFSYVERPQQNFVVEHKHQHLITQCS